MARGPANSATASPTRSRSGSAELCSWLPICGRSRSASRDRVEPEHPYVAGVGTPQPLQALDRGGLAGAVGADQADHLAGADVEVEVVDDDPAAVRLGEPPHRHHAPKGGGVGCSARWLRQGHSRVHVDNATATGSLRASARRQIFAYAPGQIRRRRGQPCHSTDARASRPPRQRPAPRSPASRSEP